MKISSAAPVFLLLLSGCASYQPLGVSSTNVGSQYERPIGMAEGKAVRWEFFPCYSLCAVGDDSLIGAVNNALDGKVGDTLSNVYAERVTAYFPFPWLHLVSRTEIRIMGTLVKYNTREFPPDRNYVYSGYPGEMWSQLVSLNKAEQARFSRGLSDKDRSTLINFALDKEKDGLIETGSKDSEAFTLLLLREPRTVTPKAVLKDEARINLNQCNTYECIITLSPEKQAEALKLAKGDKAVRAALLDSARKRIKACYPGRTPAIVTVPEVQLIYNEETFLETLCISGDLKS